ncbi:hypothetical protein ACHAW6_008047 [Cyclotella cf. meneghiniana]
MQQWHGLQWTFETPSLSVNFMDLTISVVHECLETTLYGKPQNLYLYLPPHSAHPQRIKTGLIFGPDLHIHCLCSNKDDSDTYIKNLFQWLVAHGHTPEKLIPIFTWAKNNATCSLL